MLTTYIQKAWGDLKESVTMDDIRNAISEIQYSDAEHGAFWVGIVEEFEIVLETHKDLYLIGVFDSDEEIKMKANSWDEIEYCYWLLLNGKIGDLRNKMIKN